MLAISPAKGCWQQGQRTLAIDTEVEKKSSGRWPSTRVSTKKVQRTLAVDKEVDESKSSGR